MNIKAQRLILTVSFFIFCLFLLISFFASQVMLDKNKCRQAYGAEWFTVYNGDGEKKECSNPEGRTRRLPV